DVAAKNMVTNSWPQLWRNFSAFLYRQIRDAASGVEFIGFSQRIRRTRINAAGAGAAAVCDGQVGQQLERCENHAQKNPRAKPFIQDAGVLSNPSNAGVFGVDALDMRPGIHVAAYNELGLGLG